MALGGRCRTCKLPISKRYPIVEAAVGFSLTLLGVAQLYRVSIPVPLDFKEWDHWHSGPFWSPYIDRTTLYVLIFHAVAVATSWALGLIRFDRERLPGRLVVFTFIALVVPMLAYPTLMIIPWQTARPEEWFPDGLYFDAVMRVVTALVAAALIGRTLARGLCPSADPKMDPLGKGTARLMDLIVIIAVPAVIVGWQAVPAVVLLASLVALVLRRIFPSTTDMFGCFALAVPIALTIQLVFWRHLHFAPVWPSDYSSHWVILAYAAALLVAPFWLNEQSDGAPVPVVTPNADGPDNSLSDEEHASDSIDDIEPVSSEDEDDEVD